MDSAAVIVCSAADANHAEAGGDNTASDNKTQTQFGCQFQATNSNNTDNQDNHRLSAVSNRAAAGPDESGPCRNYPADMDPTADGWMGPRRTIFPDAAPTSNATSIVDVGLERSGVQDSAVRAQFYYSYKISHESDRSITSGGMTQATSIDHHLGGDWSGHRGVAHDPGQSPHLLEAHHAYTAAAPASSCAPHHDVRHSEHRNEETGSWSGGVQYSAVGQGQPSQTQEKFFGGTATAPAPSFALPHYGQQAASPMPGFAPLHADQHAAQPSPDPDGYAAQLFEVLHGRPSHSNRSADSYAAQFLEVLQGRPPQSSQDARDHAAQLLEVPQGRPPHSNVAADHRAAQLLEVLPGRPPRSLLAAQHRNVKWPVPIASEQMPLQSDPDDVPARHIEMDDVRAMLGNIWSCRILQITHV
jgi:hypothetical protein